MTSAISTSSLCFISKSFSKLTFSELLSSSIFFWFAELYLTKTFSFWFGFSYVFTWNILSSISLSPSICNPELMAALKMENHVSECMTWDSMISYMSLLIMILSPFKIPLWPIELSISLRFWKSVSLWQWSFLNMTKTIMQPIAIRFG